MMNTLLKSIIYISVVFTISCTEEIDLNLKTGKKELIVDAVFTDQSIDHWVKLSVTADYFSNEQNPAVSGAHILFSDGYNTITLHESSLHEGWYIIPASFKAFYGRKYTIEITGVDINNDGIEENHQASNILKPVTRVDAIDLSWSLTQGQKQWQVKLFSKDNEEPGDSYAFLVYINNELISSKISDIEVVNDDYFNGNDVNGVWVQSIVEEDGEGKKTDYELKEGDWVTLEMQTINADYYDFISAVHEETGLKIPLFSGPPANVPTNISNGARGFFRVYSISRDSIQVTKEILNQRN